MTPGRHGDRRRRRRALRSLSRIAAGTFLSVVALAPVAWERFPAFGLVFTPETNPTPPKSPADPDQQVDDGGVPSVGTVISPDAEYPTSTDPGFRYFASFGDRPPIVSTCSPFPFVIRRDSGPPKGGELVVGGLQRIANATGISFEFKGFTDKIYSFNESRTAWPWDDDRQALWIGWAFDSEVPDLGPRSDSEPYAVGVGGPITVERGDGEEIVGGGVVLRADEALAVTFGSGSNFGNVLLHELGHAMGLDHVELESEIMFPVITEGTPADFAAGDLAGLQGIRAVCDA